jgi:archaellum biogenesis protein FlaJ (TadC family)
MTSRTTPQRRSLTPRSNDTLRWMTRVSSWVALPGVVVIVTMIKKKLMTMMRVVMMTPTPTMMVMMTVPILFPGVRVRPPGPPCEEGHLPAEPQG